MPSILLFGGELLPLRATDTFRSSLFDLAGKPLPVRSASAQACLELGQPLFLVIHDSFKKCES